MNDDYDRRLKDIARRRDRFLIPRNCWDERDWREHRREQLRSLLYQPTGVEIPIIPKHAIPAGFGGLHGLPRDRDADARRRKADRALRHWGVR